MTEKKAPPRKIFYVERTPADDDPKRYYSIKHKRFYKKWAHVRLFLAKHPTSTFRVFEADDVEWKEIEDA